MSQLTFALGGDAGQPAAAGNLPRWTQPRNFRSFRAEVAFRGRLEELGATLLEPLWLGSKVKHRAICAAGHLCTPTPHYVRAGDGICKTCGGHDPVDTAARFRAILDVFGAELLEPEWLGANTPHHVRCGAGHDGYPRPSSVLQGNGPCWTCSGTRFGVSEEAFRARVAELGGECIYGAWLGAMEPHALICAAGHKCSPRPAGVMQGQGICRACSGTDTATAEAKFRARVIELGGTPLYEFWRGTKESTHIRCPQGHDAYPRPNDVLNGNGLCKTCAGLDPKVSEAKFLARLAELGAEPLYTEWRGSQVPHAVRCAGNHVCRPRPQGVIQGQGVCQSCAGRAPTVFYVVENKDRQAAKFGITSQDGQNRLSRHRAAGFTTVHLLVAGLAEGVAREAEQAVKVALTEARSRPIQGHEYFAADDLALILDIACSWVGEIAA